MTILAKRSLSSLTTSTLVLRPAAWAVGQQPGGFGAEVGIRFIQGIQQEQVAEVEDAGFGFREIKVLPAPEGIGAAIMEKGAVATVLLGHDIGVGGGGLGGDGEVRVSIL